MGERITIKATVVLFFFFVFGAMIQCSSGGAYASDSVMDGYVKEGQSLLVKEDYKAGVSSLAKAVNESATNNQKNEYIVKTLDVLREITDELFEKEDTEACANIKEILECAFEYSFYKKSEMLHNQMGSVFRKTGMIEEAMAEYVKALEIEPDYAPSRFNLALCYFKQKEFQKSYHELNKIPESASLYQVAQEKKNLLLKNFGVKQI